MRTHHVHAGRRAVRGIAASTAVVAGLSGLAACSDSAGPEQGAVTTEDLQELQDSVADLEDRVAGMEGTLPDVGADGGNAGESDIFGEDAQNLVGQQVTVSAEVSELVDHSEIGAAFYIAGESGEPIAVLSAGQVDQLQPDDVVEVSGTVKVVQRDSFEEDFGAAADDLFTDPDAFFDEAENQVAIAADSVEVIDEQAGE